MSVDTSWWTDEGPRHWALTNCGGTSSKWCCSLVERTANDAGADVSSRGMVAESTCETLIGSCSETEGIVVSVIEAVGDLTSSMAESTCTSPGGGCDGDEWGLGTFDEFEVSSGGMEGTVLRSDWGRSSLELGFSSVERMADACEESESKCGTT